MIHPNCGGQLVERMHGLCYRCNECGKVFTVQEYQELRAADRPGDAKESSH